MPDTPPSMTSHRPYLLRALYEWIADNGMTPHILVDAQQPGVRVPPHTVKEGRVVLNIAERAVAKLELDNESVRFTARFGGVSHPVMVPIAAVMAIYARETGQGMALPEDTMADPPEDDPTPPDDTPPDSKTDDEAPAPAKRPPFLRVVK
ncbi:ClpXP protease specificity-enhancing factor [Luteimonas aestuarii]|uniref:ClpXP protease specificity-enhancing factor n=1 Tax=Luteimonas aestuarii TaxID=453837 RepID=A0A4R5U1L8_9GAMM|nr:ClpXP protease specificity-enhancing factor [Luteimonas aestuarii]TDK27510.1 ClpXP protease specificity-enhancing factor [Luteimonas aestuarii]